MGMSISRAQGLLISSGKALSLDELAHLLKLREKTGLGRIFFEVGGERCERQATELLQCS